MRSFVVPIQLGVLLLSLADCTSKAPSVEGPSPSGGISPGPVGGATPNGSGGSAAVAGSTGSGGSQSTAVGSGGSSQGGSAPAGEPSTGAGGSGAIPAGAAVPPTGFLFTRAVRDGTSVSEHIYMFDLATQQETLVTNLDHQPGQTGAHINDLALSPDRRRIAFSSTNFRPTAVEIENRLRLGSLWTTTLEGKEFQRVTAPYPASYNIGTPCGGANLPCSPGESCRSSRCIRRDLSVSVRSPLWAPDNKTILYEDFHMWWSGTDTFHQFAYLHQVSDAGQDSLKLPGICSHVAPLAILPTSQDLLLVRNGCRDVKPGIVTFSQSPLAEKTLVVAETSELYMPTTTGVLSPDGSALFYVALGRNPKRGSSLNRSVLQRWLVGNGENKQLYESPSDEQDITEVTVTPSGAVIVEITTTGSDRAISGRLARFDVPSGTLEFLPLQGDVRMPR